MSDKTLSTNLTIRLLPEEYEALKNFADSQNVSISSVARRAIAVYLKGK